MEKALKLCNRCEEEKGESEFHIDKTYTCGFKPTCKTCYNMGTRKHYRENGGKEKCLKLITDKLKDEDYHDKRKAYARKQSHTLTGRLKMWRYSARKRNLEWEITREQIDEIPKVCYYTGVDLTFSPSQPNTISIERLDSSKNYTKDNVVFCCADINRMKQEFSMEYFLDMCKRVVDYANKKG